jgi:peptidoglycan hydrolase FlgJ
MLTMTKSPTTFFQKLQAQGANSPGRALTPQQKAKIEAAAKDFEAVYMSEMLKPMFATIKTDTMFGGGKAEETFRGLLLQEYGKKIADTGGLGLAKYVKAEMIRMQENQK